MEDFVSIRNFKHLFNLLNSYSKDKYNVSLDFKKYKFIIGNTIEEIYSEYKYKINKKQGNAMTIHVLKSIIKKNIEKKYFEAEIKKDKKYNNLKNLTNIVDRGKLTDDSLKIRPVFEKRFDKILKNNNSNPIDKSLIIEKRYDEDIKDYFIYQRDIKPQPIDLTQNPKQYQEELIISPDDYVKTLNKYIKYEDMVIDSRDRNTDIFPNTSEYSIDLGREIHNILSIELISAEIPNNEYIINENNNLIYFQEKNNITLIGEVLIGNYTLTTLVVAIESALEDDGDSNYAVSHSGNKITILSDLTGGGSILNLLFVDKKNNIGETIGFETQDLSGNNTYTSNDEIILDTEKKVFLYIEGLDNIDVISEYSSNRFVQLTLDSSRGEYSYFKNFQAWTEHFNNEFIFLTHTPINFKKLKITFKDYNNNLYNFYGLEHNLHLRFKYFNFDNMLINTIGQLN
jgi:hypothetical protein